MKQIFENLYCGNDADVYDLYSQAIPTPGNGEGKCPSAWAVVHAAKEKWHRMVVGYTGRGCPKDSPFYYLKEFPKELYLNIVDAPLSIFFSKEMIDKALDFIEQKLGEGLKVLVHCNEGFSRSPSICLLYLIKNGIIKGETLEDCEAELMQIYPAYNPGTGMRGFVKEHWLEYVK
jgi:hypothetical protein